MAVSRNLQHLQYLGTIDTEAGESWLLLCVDADLPEEGILSWQSNKLGPIAAQVHILRDGATWRMKILHAFEEKNGQVKGMVLSPVDQAKMLRLEAELNDIGNGMLHGHWSGADDGQQRPMRLAPLNSFNRRVTANQCETWDDYKRWVNRIHDAGALAFRGQANREWVLQTTLFRAGRANLLRYDLDTLPEFHNHLDAINGARIERDKPTEFGRLVAIAQHHGFPTPLLDWTLSPYVAAWFAFSDVLENHIAHLTDQTGSDARFVRIYALTPAFAQAFSPKNVPHISSLAPYAAFMNFSARDNPRAYAQQGRFVMTNLGDLEGYLVWRGQQQKRDFLWAADIPASEAPRALKDLALMGLTSATLFPGLEGTCRMLRHQILLSNHKARIGTSRGSSDSGNAHQGDTPS